MVLAGHLAREECDVELRLRRVGLGGRYREPSQTAANLRAVSRHSTPEPAARQQQFRFCLTLYLERNGPRVAAEIRALADQPGAIFLENPRYVIGLQSADLHSDTRRFR